MLTVDFLMSSYGIPLEDAVFRFSLVAAAALNPAAIHRNGGDLGGTDLVMKARLRARRRAEEVLRKEYRIIP